MRPPRGRLTEMASPLRRMAAGIGTGFGPAPGLIYHPDGGMDKGSCDGPGGGGRKGTPVFTESTKGEAKPTAASGCNIHKVG